MGLQDCGNTHFTNSDLTIQLSLVTAGPREGNIRDGSLFMGMTRSGNSI